MESNNQNYDHNENQNINQSMNQINAQSINNNVNPTQDSNANINHNMNPNYNRGVYNNMPPQNIAYRPYGYAGPKPETAEQLAERVRVGGFLIKATVVFALITTFCLYKNLSGVTMPLFAITTIIYMYKVLEKTGIKVKKLSWVYAFFIMELSISTFLTGNSFYIFFNEVGMLLLIFVFLLHNVYDDRKWNFAKTTLSIIEAAVLSIGTLNDFGKDRKAIKSLKGVQEVKEDSERSGMLKSIVIGLIIAIPVVAILTILLTSADMVFKTLIVDNLHINVNFGDIFGILITFAFSYFAGYCVLRFFSRKTIKEDMPVRNGFEAVIAITVLVIVSILYLIFSLIQILYLFWGGMQLPKEYTYAEYAREGFFQLLAVCIINVIMVLFIKGFFRKSKILNMLLTIISLCTYIMIASSCMRMIMYINVYHLTFLRILVLWALALLAVLLIGVIISIYSDKFPLFRYGVLLVSVLYIALSFSHTDRIIAHYNLSVMDTYSEEEYDDESQDYSYLGGRNKETADYEYLTELSTDAAVEIAPNSGKWVEDYFNNNKYTYKKMNWRTFNLSRYTAKQLDTNK